MRRPILLYVLISAVPIAAIGLAYYGYSYSSELSQRERAVIIDTMRELAEEKIIGVESELIESENAVFNRVDIANLLELKDILASERPAIESVVILDHELKIVPGGFFTKRPAESVPRFRTLLMQQVIPDLNLLESNLDERGHRHAYYEGRTYLFSYIRRFSRGRLFFIVLEADLAYLVGTVFPQFFGVRSPRLYQVVDEAGELIYGFDFTRLSGRTSVDLRFTETVDRWRLRVAQRKESAIDTERPRLFIDPVLIGSALAVIIAGLVTLLVGLRRERRANALKSEFISNVSHELKTPLSIISMFGEMLALGRTRSTDQATEYAEIIWKESVRLARLIDNVLDFAKIERGAVAYEFADGDVADVACRAIELSSRRLQGADMEVTTHIEDDLPAVPIDSNALTLAILNLIDNAVKYASSGKKIELSVNRVETGGKPRIELAVRDFGPGIPVDEQSRIFERFYRSRTIRLKPIRGSGIGLALAKHIVTAHGGDIEVDSRPDDEADPGATFRLWIPCTSHG